MLLYPSTTRGVSQVKSNNAVCTVSLASARIEASDPPQPASQQQRRSQSQYTKDCFVQIKCRFTQNRYISKSNSIPSHIFYDYLYNDTTNSRKFQELHTLCPPLKCTIIVQILQQIVITSF